MSDIDERADMGQGEVTINLARLWGDFREFRGEMRAEMTGLKTQLSDSLAAMREAASNHGETRLKVEELERLNLNQRLMKLEGNWRLALWLGTVIGVLTLGLVFDGLRGWIFGG